MCVIDPCIHKDKYYISLTKQKDLQTVNQNFCYYYFAVGSPATCLKLNKKKSQKKSHAGMMKPPVSHVLQLMISVLPKKDRKACRVEIISCSVLQQHPAWLAGSVRAFTKTPATKSSLPAS